MQPPILAEGEIVEREIPPSPKTTGYYSLKAAPLFGVWFIGLLVFLIYTYKNSHSPLQYFLFQALALAGFAYLVGTVARWLWRVDVAQRGAWLTNKGVRVQTPLGPQYVSYGQIARVRVKRDWMEKWLHLDEIEIQFVSENRAQKIVLIGVENAEEIVNQIQGKLPPSV